MTNSPTTFIKMPKNLYDQYDTKCTKCRQEVYAGGGNQFVDDDSILQRYCNKCWKKYWQALEKKYDTAAAESEPESSPVPSPEPEPPKSPDVGPAPVAQQLPPPPIDVIGTQGDGAPTGPAVQ